MYMSSATIETVYMYTIWVTMHAMQKFQMLGSYMEDLTKPYVVISLVMTLSMAPILFITTVVQIFQLLI